MNNKLLILPLYIILYSIANMSYSECRIYIKFTQNNNEYKIDYVSDRYIDFGNVLKANINTENDKLVDLDVPASNETTFNNNFFKYCSTIYSNSGNHAYCSGQFTTENTGDDIINNTAFTILTLGLAPFLTGIMYTTSPNEHNIMLAKNSVNLHNEKLQKYLQTCRNNEQMTKQQHKEKSLKLAQQEEKEHYEISTWLKSMPTFRSRLIQGMNTNCGTFIERKGNIVHVQSGSSSARDIWIPLSNIFTPTDPQQNIVGCHDENVWYKKYGNWVNDNTTIINNTPYNDSI